MLIPFVLAAVISYLLGSIPNGLLIGKLRGVDIREHGSRNIGATNAFRVLGKPLGILTFLLDAGKGFAAVLVGFALAGEGAAHAYVGITAAVFAILGHNFPVWLRFKGGKGVATSLGVIIGLIPVAAGLAFAVWLAVLFLSRYVSVASIVATVSVPISVAFLERPPDRAPLLTFAILAAALIVVRHKTNIQRLLNGTENRFVRKKSAQ